MLLAAAGGADPTAVREALRGGFSESRILHEHGQRILDRNWMPGGQIRNMLKDLNAVVEAATDCGLELPFVSLARSLFQALYDRGVTGSTTPPCCSRSNTATRRTGSATSRISHRAERNTYGDCMNDWTEDTSFAIELITIIAPFVSLSMFVGMTERMSNRGRIKTAGAAVTTMAIALLATQYAGTAVITALGTTLPSFQIAGGLIIVLAGFTMLRSEVEDATAPTAYGDSQAIKICVVPLGIPLMAGPGSFTAVILESQHSHSGGDLAVSLTILGVAAVMFVLYLLAVPIARALGPVGLNIITRLFGLIVTAIGVEIIVRGVLTHAENFAKLT